MKWGIDSNIFIHLDSLEGRYSLDDLVLALLEFCEKKSGNVSKIYYLKKQVGNSRVLLHIARSGLIPANSLEELFDDETLIAELENLISGLKRIRREDPEYRKFKELKKYLSHFQSENFDLYDICFFLAHKEEKINFSLLRDKPLSMLLNTYGYKCFFCRYKHHDLKRFLDTDNCVSEVRGQE